MPIASYCYFIALIPIISHLCPYNYKSPCGEDFQILQKGYVRAEASTAFLVQAWSSHVLICYWMCFDTCMMLVGGLDSLDHFFIFPLILGIINSPNWFLVGGGNHQPDVFWILIWCVYVFDMCWYAWTPMVHIYNWNRSYFATFGHRFGINVYQSIYLLPPVDPEISGSFLSFWAWKHDLNRITLTFHGS